MGKKSSEQTSTQTSSPWEGVQPHLTNVFNRAESLANTPQSYFDGQTYADYDPLQQAGMNSQLGYATNGMQNQIDGTQAAHMSQLNAPDVANNPYLSAMGDTITNRLNRNFNENLMPSIQAGANLSGQAGGSRQGVAQGIAARGTQEALGDSLSSMYGNAYGQGLNAQGNAISMAPQVANLGLAPGQIQQQIGGMNQAQDQRGIDEAVARHNYAQDEGWDRVSRYNSLLSGGAGYGTTTSTQPSQGGGLFGNLLGGGLAVAGMMQNPMMGLGGLFGGRR